MKKLLLIFFCILLMIGYYPIHADETENNDDVITYEELDGKSVGIQTGSILDGILPNIINDVKIVYFESLSDMREALMSGKVDAIAADEPKLRYLAAVDSQIVYRKEVFQPMEYAFVLNKEEGNKLCIELNEYIKKIKENGLLDEMTNDWFDPNKHDRQIPDYKSLPATNGSISYAIDASIVPFGFVRNGDYAGLEVEIITRFCEEKGYGLDISNVQFASLIPGVYSGKYDIASSCFTITKERAESVLFSDPTYIGGSTIAVKKSNNPQLNDYENKRIATLTGTIFSEIIDNNFPDATKVYFDTTADALLGLKTNKVDAIALDEPVARNILAEDKDTIIAEGYLAEFDYAYIFSKSEQGQKLCDEISSFIKTLKENGSLKEIQNKWFDNIPNESLMSVNPNDLEDINGSLGVITIQYPPFSIQGQDTFYGYEIELLTLFAKEKGYKLYFTNVNANAVVAAVQSNKFDLGASSIAITEERKEEMLFSEPSYSGGVVLLVSKEDSTNKVSFFDSIKESFDKTFIREDRYKLFLEGILTTVLITLLSVLFGSVLGFVIYLLCRKGNAIANTLAKIFSWLMTGMPMVVLLMILYYVVFGKSSISGTTVSIIGFTLVFGAEVYNMMNTAVKAVDYGQTEAAYALGYSYWASFFRYILPQAIPYFLPSYRGSLISLVKATAIVGYVAVQDLTKMGDIVRSRTYEAFFPLIAIAIIYFILGALLVFIINRITVFLDPTRRSKKDILKGIDTHD